MAITAKGVGYSGRMLPSSHLRSPHSVKIKTASASREGPRRAGIGCIEEIAVESSSAAKFSDGRSFLVGGLAMRNLSDHWPPLQPSVPTRIQLRGLSARECLYVKVLPNGTSRVSEATIAGNTRFVKYFRCKVWIRSSDSRHARKGQVADPSGGKLSHAKVGIRALRWPGGRPSVMYVLV